MPSRPTWLAALALAVAGAPGCSAAYHVAAADREVAAVLDEKTDQALGHRAGWVVRPLPSAETAVVAPEAEAVPPAEGTAAAPASGDDVGPPVSAAPQAGASGGVAASQDGAEATGSPPVVPDAPVPAAEAAAAGEGEPVPVDLAASLALAFAGSREYLDRRDVLYLQGLGLTLTRFGFGPQVDALVSSLWTQVEDGSSVLTHAAAVDVGQILPTGGVLSVGGGLSRTRTAGLQSYGTDVGFSLSQPLLRGAGYEASHEELTQAERDLVYAVRAFELFRQDFAISIAQDFFDLVRQQRQLANDEQNYLDAVFDREKAEALRQVDRNRDEDVFIARRREINAETDLLSARADLELALDSFRIRLGLAEGTRLVVEDVEPPFEPVRVDSDSAAAVALHNRLDLLTERERVQDDERQVRIAKNGLLPQVDLDLSYDVVDAGRPLRDAWPSQWAAAAGLAVEIPLQRTPERNTYASALVDLERNRRELDLLLEETERDVRDALRQLRRNEQQVVLQLQQIAQERRAVAVTEIRFESGEAEARDLLDARQSLLDAENSLIDLKVDHFIGRLRLYRDLGLLFVSDDGSWQA